MYKESFFFLTIFISQIFLCKVWARQYGDPQVNQMPEEGTDRGEVFQITIMTTGNDKSHKGGAAFL